MFYKISFFKISFLLIPGVEVGLTWAPSEFLFHLVNPCKHFAAPASLVCAGV